MGEGGHALKQVHLGWNFLAQCVSHATFESENGACGLVYEREALFYDGHVNHQNILKRNKVVRFITKNA